MYPHSSHASMWPPNLAVRQARIRSATVRCSQLHGTSKPEGKELRYSWKISATSCGGRPLTFYLAFTSSNARESKGLTVLRTRSVATWR